LGYLPWASPIIVPPLMVRDFNFTALAEVA